MSSIRTFFHIPDKKQDVETITDFINITNIGIEAITQIYDDHRLDKHTSNRIFILQENLIYRIYAVFHQYEILIDGLNSKTFVDLNVDPDRGALESHPTIHRYSNELSSVVDSMFFHQCSVFDYLGHFISYMFEKNKDKTMDWGSLAKKARAGYTAMPKSAEGIREVDNRIRIKLEWYRSQLIHRRRDLRHIGITVDQKTNRLSLIFAAAAETMKHFNNIVPAYDKEANYTLDFLPSLVIYQTLHSINYLLDFLKVDLLSDSYFEENVKNPKHTGLPYIVHPLTNKPYPKSEVIWSEYKRHLHKFYLDLEQRKTGAGV